MDCTICLEDNLNNEKMEYLNCGHSICNDCYIRLIKNLCPFCRSIFSGKDNKFFNNILNNDYESIEVIEEIDNLLPESELQEISSTYNTYYPNIYILRRLNMTKKPKKKHTTRFRPNCQRDKWERRSKKNKKSKK